jgi:hypothetical protein
VTFVLFSYVESSCSSSLTGDCSLEINACVKAWPTVTPIVACTTIERVITNVAKELVITTAASYAVKTIAAIHDVITIAAKRRL